MKGPLLGPAVRGRIRVASWPHWYGPNPYLPLLYAALAEHGIEHVANLPLVPEEFRSSGRRADVLHLHWLYPLWRPGPRWWIGNPGIGRALRKLRAIRETTPVVWTVHNLEPHDGFRRGERAAYGAVYRMADLLVFHTELARERAEAMFGPTDADRVVMRHGLLGRGFPPPGESRIVRETEGLPVDAVLLLCFGQVRRNKGFDTAVRCARLLGRPYHLLVAGRPLDREAGRLERLARGADNVSLLLDSIEDQRLSDLLGAADVVLLPYRSVTSSGALLHALSMDSGIVASDLPFFREVLGDEPAVAQLVAPGEPEELAAGIVRCLAVPAPVRRRALERLRERYAWSDCVAPLADWLRQSPRRRRTEDQSPPCP